MRESSLSIWCNAHFPPAAFEELRSGVGPHRLIVPADLKQSNLVAGGADPLLADADIALGQPDPGQVIALQRLRWVHLTSAGYTRYDTPAVRDALRARGAALTNSSAVYADPCAQHVLAMMMALARQLPQCWADQARDQSWNAAGHRIRSHLLTGQTAVLLGFGAIGRRLAELLSPFGMNLYAVRRSVAGNEPVKTLTWAEAREVLPAADHVINLLPANASTDRVVDAAFLSRMNPSALFYNIGRGTTVDTPALTTALQEGKIAGAYLDVTDPEPLPPVHPLWLFPNVWITPHTAGGHATEFHRLVRHFLANLRRFERGEMLLDRVV